MSIKKLPDYRLKQKILYIDKTSAASLISYGDLYLEAGAQSDALEFYAKAGHIAGMQKIKDIAIATGDVFLFQSAAKLQNTEHSEDEWGKIARAAIEYKKYAFARHALANISNAELQQALKTTIQMEEAKQSA